MKNKKLYVGTIALALSIGAIAPVRNNVISSVAYATGAENTDPNSGAASENKTTKLDKLKDLTDEKSSVQNSARYNIASESERKAYDNAISAGREANNTTEDKKLDELIANIQQAKDKFGTDYLPTNEQRQGLSSTIAIAEKLSKTIANDNNVSKADKEKLTNAINSAKSDEKNLAKSGDEINTTNKTLAQTINDIISDNNLEAKNSALTNDEIEKITPADSTSYGRAYKNLLELDKKAYGYTELDEFKNITDSNIKNNLNNSLTKAEEVYKNVSSTTVELNTAYNNLNKAYNDALTAANSKNTEASRLKSQIQNEINTSPAGFENAGQTARLTYNIAKANANAVLKKENATADELKKALNNLNLAKLALAPIKTKVIDSTEIEKAPKDILKELVDAATTYKTQDPYKSASDADKKSYDDAITAANGVLQNNKSSVDDLNAAIQTIKDAQNKIASSKETGDQNSYDQAKVLLDSLVRNKEEVTKSTAYTSANSDKKSAYDKAISDASLVLKDIADGKDISTEKINENISKIVNALTDLGYKDVVKYSNTLKELVDEAPTFRQTYGYYVKNNSSKDSDKSLIKTYNDLIKLVSENLDTLSQDTELSQKYVDRINEIKRKIVGQSSNPAADENKESLQNLIDLATKVQAHPDYVNVKATQSKNLNKAIIAARRALNSDNASDIEDARTYLTNQLNQSEIKPIVAKINNLNESEDLKELRKLAELATKVTKHKEYANVDKDLKDKLEDALKKANLAIQSKDKTKIKEAKDTLSNVLADDKFKKIIEDINKNEKSSRQNIEDFIKGDKNLRDSVNYKKAQKTLRDAYDKAIEEGKAILENKDASEEDLSAVSEKIMQAVNALDGNQFAARVEKLKEKYKKDGSQITNANKKAAVEAKLKALEDKNATMDDLLAAETELTNALKLNGSSTPVTTTTNTTTVPGTRTTTTPVTTTRQVPSTINPGSIVRTGIKSLVGVGVLLVAAIGAYILTGKNKEKDKNKNVKAKRRKDNEIK
ncbi:FIVAR domain-containing protein [Anaerococcus sp. mt242]|uniref:FIVAR domain-containing protein n=1 Tax=Anaerococcus sp. mt242 TaxID=2661917 RepID=UPI0019326E4D|nr:FIVAR domain-containing protein [Anaerococcus sp. mt242]MBM0045639.1 FIVAR domain-containing protein [Anaerococcus sp. mt242]